MAVPTREELLQEKLMLLMESTVEVVHKRLLSEDASPSDIKNALTLLKDNGVVLPSKQTRDPILLADLTEDLIELPFSGVTIDTE